MSNRGTIVGFLRVMGFGQRASGANTSGGTSSEYRRRTRAQVSARPFYQIFTLQMEDVCKGFAVGADSRPFDSSSNRSVNQ